MLKKELIWREILDKIFSEGIFTFTQKGLSEKIRCSLSTVNHALRLPREVGAIKVSGRNFQVVDKEKFLLLWASHRRLNREVVYKTNAEGGVQTLEGLMPPQIIYGAYSAFAKKYQPAPADYDTIYIYADPEGLAEIKTRFPPRKGPANLIVLKADPPNVACSPFFRHLVYSLTDTGLVVNECRSANA